MFFTRALKITLILSAACLYCDKSSAVTLPPSEKILPEKTVFLVNVDDFNRFHTKLQKTSFYKLSKDPAMAAFISDLRLKLLNNLEKSGLGINGSLIDVNTTPSGRLTYAMTIGSGSQPNPAAWVIISQWGGNLNKIQKTVDKMVAGALEDGMVKSQENYRGIDIISIKPKKSEPPKTSDFGNACPNISKPAIAAAFLTADEDMSQAPPMPMPKTYQPPRTAAYSGSGINYCFIEDVFIVSADIDLLKFVVSKIKSSEGASLADDSDYISAMRAIGPSRDVDFYVNIKQIFRQALSEDSTGQVQTVLSNFGVDNLTSFGCSFVFAPKKGFSLSGKSLLKVNGPKKGLLKMLEPDSQSVNPPVFVGSSASSVFFANWDVKKMYDELYRILYTTQPMSASMMAAPLIPPGPDGQPGLELKKDILNYLGAPIVVAETIDKTSSDSTPKSDITVSLAVNDRLNLERSLSRLHGEIIAKNNPSARREFLGYTIYILDLPSFAVPHRGTTPLDFAETAAPAAGPRIAFTVTDTHLVFGTEPAVEQVLRRLKDKNNDSITAAKWFKAAKSAVPQVFGLAGMSNQVAYYEQIWRMLKKQGTGTTGAMMPPTPFTPFQNSHICNFALLPDFSTVKKYFGLSASYGVSRDDGFYFEFHSFDEINTPGEE